MAVLETLDQHNKGKRKKKVIITDLNSKRNDSSFFVQHNKTCKGRKNYLKPIKDIDQGLLSAVKTLKQSQSNFNTSADEPLAALNENFVYEKLNVEPKIMTPLKKKLGNFSSASGRKQLFRQTKQINFSGVSNENQALPTNNFFKNLDKIFTIRNPRQGSCGRSWLRCSDECSSDDDSKSARKTDNSKIPSFDVKPSKLILALDLEFRNGIYKVKNSSKGESCENEEHNYSNNHYIPKVSFLTERNIKALIPNKNLQDYKGPFKVKVEDRKIITIKAPQSSMRIHYVSPVVSVTPHEVTLFDYWPAILIIPLRIKPKLKNGNRLSCFYSSRSPRGLVEWQRLPSKDYFYSNGNLIVITCHFSAFTAVFEEPYPEISKKIRCRSGGKLRIRNVPGIEVNFPRGCLERNIDACLQVMFDHDPSLDGCSTVNKSLLASPIISLSPHGLQFSSNRKPVLITLPIPNYKKIMDLYPSAKLIAYESSTDVGEPMLWKKIDIEISSFNFIGCKNGISKTIIPVVTFPVYHFSFFKIMWELLSTTLYEAKMSMSYFYPYISFSMMCQAFMEESQENDKFALEVICYRSDRKLPEVTNYRYRVGASLNPKLVYPGRISVRLQSQMFEADVEAGEDSEMTKEEPDFRGRDFEKQFACKFKPRSNIERGTFGKVIIERISTKKDLLFEFNLHKAGTQDNQVPSSVNCDRWVMLSMKEVATSLKITEGANWKQLARVLGFTNSEIENILSYSPDPLVAIMNIYSSRGGTLEEFVQAAYRVFQKIKGIAPVNECNCAGSSNSEASGSQYSRFRKIWKIRPWGNSKDSDLEDSNQWRSNKISKGKKRSRQSSKTHSPVTPKRRKISEEEVLSSSSGSEVELRKFVAEEKYKKSTGKLGDKDLWRISLGIARRDWKNLGRTLGIEEIVLINLEHSHQSVGFRECAYQMLLEWKSRKPKNCTFGELYSALLREKMGSVAKIMVNRISHKDGYSDEESDL